MLKKKRISAFIFAVLLMLGVCASCAGTSGTENTPSEEEYDPGLIPRAYDSAEFDGKAIKNLTIEGTDISQFTIIYPAKTDYPAEVTAANELADYIRKSTGNEVPVRDDSAEKSDHEILIGHTNREDGTDRSGLGSDGFVIRTSGGNLIITGDGERGTIYGVYEFCEKYLGWRFLTGECEVIYPAERIDVSSAELKEVPAIAYRDSFWRVYQEEKISAKRKLTSGFGNGHQLTAAYGGMLTFASSPVHTFSDILGCDRTTQPCLSDPDVVEKTIGYIDRVMAENPDARLISISQNDSGDYCQCEQCAAVDEEEGSPSGSIIRYVNSVAGYVKEHYPDVMIHTLAYTYSRKPPKTKPADNVVVQYCTIERCKGHSICDPDCETNAKLCAELEDWFALTDNVMVWDYFFNPACMLAEQPNVYSIREDVEYYAGSGVYGVFGQGITSGNDVGFNALKAYLCAKVLWDTDMTEEEYEAAIVDFMKGYYGDGWKYVKDFMDYYHECGLNKGDPFGSGPFDLMTADEITARGDGLLAGFEEAEKLADGDEMLLDHLCRAKITLQSYISEVSNAPLLDLFFEDPEKYDEEFKKWKESVIPIYKAIIEKGIALREFYPPDKYNDSLAATSLFGW